MVDQPAPAGMTLFLLPQPLKIPKPQQAKAYNHEGLDPAATTTLSVSINSTRTEPFIKTAYFQQAVKNRNRKGVIEVKARGLAGKEG